jgi:hypothetical protein
MKVNHITSLSEADNVLQFPRQPGISANDAAPAATTPDTPDTKKNPGRARRAVSAVAKPIASIGKVIAKFSAFWMVAPIIGGAQLIKDLDSFAIAYENNNCAIDGDDAVIAAQMNLGDNIAVALTATFAAIGSNSMIKLLRTTTGFLSKLPLPTWFLTTLLYAGTSAITYAIVRMSKNTSLMRKFGGYIAMEMTGARTLEYIVSNSATCATTESNTKMLEAHQANLNEAKTAMATELKDFVLADPKLLDIVKKANTKAKAAKATAS